MEDIFMSILADLQYSVFTNKRIEPEVANLSEMLSQINGLNKYTFFPNIAVNTNIDINTGMVTHVNNVSFVTLNQMIDINCLNDRIDVNIHPNNENQNIEIKEHIEFARAAMNIIMNNNGILANRLAINAFLLSKTFDKNIQETKLGGKYCQLLDFYTGKQIEEWFVKTNSRRNIIVEQEETLNVITELSTVIDKATAKKRFLCHMDINTLFENNGYRFSTNNLEKFDEEVLSIINEIKTNYDGDCDE